MCTNIERGTTKWSTHSCLFESMLCLFIVVANRLAHSIFCLEKRNCRATTSPTKNFVYDFMIFSLIWKFWEHANWRKSQHEAMTHFKCQHCMCCSLYGCVFIQSSRLPANPLISPPFLIPNIDCCSAIGIFIALSWKRIVVVASQCSMVALPINNFCRFVSHHRTFILFENMPVDCVIRYTSKHICQMANKHRYRYSSKQFLRINASFVPWFFMNLSCTCLHGHEFMLLW